jgi:hypothetical protein
LVALPIEMHGHDRGFEFKNILAKIKIYDKLNYLQLNP